MNIPELLSEDHTQKVVVFYGGRFQPMHKGHYKVYKFLADKFGADNIFIATMFGKKQQAMHDEKNYSRDPFTFPEKQHIISTMFNIQADHIVNTMPYRPDIKLIGRDPYTTAVILAFSEKDIGRLSPGNVLQQYNDGAKLESRLDPDTNAERVYYMTVPTYEDDMSATNFRDVMRSSASDEDKGKVFMKFFGKWDGNIFTMIDKRIN